MKTTISMLLKMFILSSTVLASHKLTAVVIDADNVSAEIKDNTLTNQTVMDVIESNPNLSTFLQALSEADLIATLEGTGSFTVFAPSNQAFNALPGNTLKDLMKKENKTKLMMILKNHIVSGKSLTTSSLTNGNMSTMGGKPLHIQVRGSQVTVDSANVIQSDLTASNGVIQIIDKVILR